jgi:rfaE bifunctional protein nucleotidyltransferase chain/domain
MNKVFTHEQLLARRASARTEGRIVVQCHGCFDIVHPGHVRHLKQAKGLGDVLLVTITGDGGVNKGAGRPLIPEELRAENLAALDFVDWVYIEPRPTASDLLEEVRPDIYVKGREYEFNSDPRFQAERQTVERHGGRVVFSSGDVVFSSTALIQAIEQSIDPFHARLSQLLLKDELQGPALFSAVSGFRGKRVLVVGETILDTYVLCDRPDVAGESPVMTLRPVERRHYDGGAAILARHAAAMGAKPVIVTALRPDDPQGEALRRRLVAEGIEVRSIGCEQSLPEKQRFLVGAQKVMKVDLCEPYVLDATRQGRLVGLAAEAAADGGGCHAAIIADFGLGLLTAGVLTRLAKAIRNRVPFISGDVSGRRSNLRAMRGLDMLCPSESELREAYGLFDEGLPTVTWRLMEETHARSAVVTMGPEGLIAFEPLAGGGGASGEGDYRSRVRGEHVPSLTPYAIDALGCGDALLTAATLARAGGASLVGATFLGSVAAAAQAQRIGNIPVSSTDLRQGIVRVHNAHLAFAAPEVVASRMPAAALRAS